MSEASSTDPWEMLRQLPMGREVEIIDPDGHVWRGTLVPSHELSGDRIIQLKLASGYNVGIRISPQHSIKVLPDASPSVIGNGSEQRSHPPTTGAGRGGSWVALLTTGGTIASRVDYRTGGVRPVKEETEILAFYPDL